MNFAYANRGVTPKMRIFMVAQTPTNNSPRVQNYTAATDTWAAGTSGALTIERGIAVGAVGGWVYTFAGSYDAGASFTVQTSPRTYKSDADAWSTGDTAHPAPRDGAVCPVLGVSVLMCGGTATGFTSDGDRGTTTVYESYLGAHVSRTAIPDKRTEAGWGQHVSTGELAARYGMICGGFERTSGVSDFLATVYEYLHIADTWTGKISMPSDRYAGGAFTIENETYIVGGATASLDADNLTSMVSWERTRNTWTSRTDITGSARRSIGCGVINGKGYAAGGSSDGVGTTNYATTLKYDPFADTWSTLTSYNTPANVVMRGAAS